MLAYGVAAQSLLYPNTEASWEILYHVVYYPYFSMYQEFPLDQLTGDCHSVQHKWVLCSAVKLRATIGTRIQHLCHFFHIVVYKQDFNRLTVCSSLQLV